MSIQFTIQHNTFNDESSIIKECKITEKNPTTEYADYKKELSDLKKQINTNDKLFEAITALEYALSQRDKPKISKILLNYATEFSQTFFTSIASTALLEFISKF